MKLLKADIPKCKLDAMPGNEAVLFVQLTHMLNELNILQKCLIVTNSRMTSLSGVERRGQVCQGLFFIRTLAAKLNEAWEMLQRDFFNSRLSGKFEKKLSKLGRDALWELKRYFGRKNNIRLIRNKFAAHYSKLEIEKEINGIPDNETLEMFISEHRGNCLYSFSDKVFSWAILNSIAPSHPLRAMNTLMGDVLRVSRWFQDFGGDCVCIIGKKTGLVYEEAEISQPPLLSSVVLPYFVERTE